MWIKSLQLTNIRAYNKAKLDFSKGINLLVGNNNAGKSTILLPLLSLQRELPKLGKKDIRLNERHADAEIEFAESDKKYFNNKNFSVLKFIYINQIEEFVLKCIREIEFEKMVFVEHTAKRTSDNTFSERISNFEPENFIYPFLSNRKTLDISEDVKNCYCPKFCETHL